MENLVREVTKQEEYIQQPGTRSKHKKETDHVKKIYTSHILLGCSRSKTKSGHQFGFASGFYFHNRVVFSSKPDQFGCRLIKKSKHQLVPNQTKLFT